MFLSETPKMTMDNMYGTMLSETYFGKIDEIVRCESYFQQMKQDLLAGKNPNKSEGKTKLEETIAALFGFEKVYFSIIADEKFANGFTMPYFANTNLRADDHFFDLVKTGNGIKYKNPKDKILYVYSYNYVLRNFTVEENMAIFLHEVGHNFFLVKEQIQYCKVNRGSELVLEALEYLRQANFSPSSFKEVTAFLLDVSKNIDNMTGAVYNEYKKLLTDKANRKATTEYETTHKGLGKIFFSTVTVLKRVVDSLINIPFCAFYTLLIPLIMKSYTGTGNMSRMRKNEKKNLDYAAEKFSDNFALSYGYSSVNAKLFSNAPKWADSTRFDDKIPIVRVINAYSNSLLYLIAAFDNEHPNDAKRVKFALDKVKYELANNKASLSPKQIAELEAELERIEKIYRDIPYYKKGFDAIFKKYWDKKDAAMTNDYTDTDIYDFDKKVVNSHITNESLDMNEIFKEDTKEFIDRYLTENDELIKELIDKI